jgi:hypothetical protein
MGFGNTELGIVKQFFIKINFVSTNTPGYEYTIMYP